MRTKHLILFFILLFALDATSGPKSDFVVWQLPSQINTIGNAYGPANQMRSQELFKIE